MALEEIARVTLAFRDEESFAHVSDPVAEDLSAAARAGDTLFLCCDETAGFDRLRPEGPGRWGAHEHYNLGDWFDLPAGPTGETDIEGLAADGGWLWIVGSHSLKREKPDRREEDPAEALGVMREITRDANRFFLGRVPLAPGEDGGLVPVAEHEGRRAACLKLREDRSALVGWLEDDPHLAPFLAIPSKENGLDIEGIEAEGDRVWLGLRGPVLRGHAVVLELNLKEKRPGRLKARRIDGKRRYRKHLLPCAGLGVRDLARDGGDLLVLAGPTLSSDGPARIFRWRPPGPEGGSGVASAEELEPLGELPYRGSRDHPEGLTRWPDCGKDAWLVVCDSPVPERLDREGLSLAADVVRLPRRGRRKGRA